MRYGEWVETGPLLVVLMLWTDFVVSDTLIETWKGLRSSVETGIPIPKCRSDNFLPKYARSVRVS